MSAPVDNESLRVLVDDDHELFRIGLRQLLAEEGLGSRIWAYRPIHGT